MSAAFAVRCCVLPSCTFCVTACMRNGLFCMLYVEWSILVCSVLCHWRFCSLELVPLCLRSPHLVVRPAGPLSLHYILHCTTKEMVSGWICLQLSLCIMYCIVTMCNHLQNEMGLGFGNESIEESLVVSMSSPIVIHQPRLISVQVDGSVVANSLCIPPTKRMFFFARSDGWF